MFFPALLTQRHRVGVERQVDGQGHVIFLTVMKVGQMRSPIEFSAKVCKEKPSGQSRAGEITKKQ